MKRLRRRYGHGLGDLPAARRPMHKARTYRGYTLEAWGGSPSEYGESAVEVKVYKGGWHHPEGSRFAATIEKAMAKARALVDAMHGD